MESIVSKYNFIDNESLENFLFSEDKTKFLDSLIKDSKQHQFFSLLIAMSQNVDILTDKNFDYIHNQKDSNYHSFYKDFIDWANLKKLDGGFKDKNDFENVFKYIRENFFPNQNDQYFHRYANIKDSKPLSKDSPYKGGESSPGLKPIDTVKTSVPNTLDNKTLDELSLQKHLEYIMKEAQACKDPEHPKNNQKRNWLQNQLRDLQKHALYSLDLEKVLEASTKAFMYVLGRIDWMAIDNLVPLLTKYYKKQVSERKNKKNLSNVFIGDQFYDLDLKSLKALAKAIPDIKNIGEFQQAKVRKIFEQNNWSQDEKDPRLRYENMQSQYNKFKKTKRFGGRKAILRANLLFLGLSIEKYDKKMFLEFLENFYSKNVDLTLVGQNDQKKKFLQNNKNAQKEQIDTFLECFMSNRFNTDGTKYMDRYCDQVDQNDIIRDYQKIFIQEKADMESFKGLISTDEMNRILAKNKLNKGEDFNTKGIFDENTLEDLRKSKFITISEKNAQNFSYGDKIKIRVDIKNINNVQVDVFEINTMNYVKDKSADFNNDIDLDGLVPKWSTSKSFDRKPIEQYEETFEFPQITERGVYLVQFLGNGLVSRAVQNIGALFLVTNPTLLGTAVMVINEKKEVCKGENTGIFLDGKQFLVDKDGYIYQPFETRGDNSYDAILFHDNFASRATLETTCQSFEFRGDFLYNSENIRQGEVCTIIFQAKLFMNSQPTSLEFVKDSQIELHILDNNNVETVKHFKNFDLDYQKDYTFNFMVPYKTKSIDMSFTGKVKKQSGDHDNLSAHQKINIDNFDGSEMRLFSTYLAKDDKKGYVVKCLGRNGESFPNETFTLTLNSYWKNGGVIYNGQFDEEGFFYLGDLANVDKVNLYMNSQKCNYTWLTNNTYVYDSFDHSDHTLILGESFKQANPLSSQAELDQGQLSFIMYSDDSIQRRCSNEAKKTEDGVVVKPSQAGSYVLSIYGQKDIKNYAIEVLQGKRWGLDDFVDTDNKLVRIEKTDQNQSLKNLNQNSEDKTLSLNVSSSDLGSCKVHLFINNFVVEKQGVNMEKLQKNCESSSKKQEFFCPEKENTYYNDGRLNDEIKYVYDRKNREKFIGSTQEKPVMLLKRAFNKETEEDKEQLKQEISAKKMAKKQKMMKSYDNEMSYKMNKRSCMQRDQMRDEPMRPGDVNRWADVEQGDVFIGCNAIVMENLVPDENTGDLKVTLPDNFNQYCSVEIYASDAYSAASTMVNSGQSSETFNKNKKDLTLQKIKEEGKVYNTSRNKVALSQKDQSHCIQDVDGTKITMVDDLSTLHSLQSIFTDNSDFKTFKFQLDWPSLTPKEKMQKYETYAGHEMNQFLYFKDKNFFNNVCLPYLPSKREKMFIDHFVLDDVKYFEKILDTKEIFDQSVDKQILSLQVLSKTISDKKDTPRDIKIMESAAIIQESFADKTRAQTESDEINDALFDTVLNLKATEVPTRVTKHLEYAQKSAPRMMKMSKSRGSPRSNMCAPPPPGMAAPQMYMAQSRSINLHAKSNYPEPLIDKFKNAGATNEFSERQYYLGSTPNVSLNAFWIDMLTQIYDFMQNSCCSHEKTGPKLLSTNFIYSKNPHESLMMMTLLSLPFNKTAPKTSTDSNTLTITAETPLMLFMKTQKESTSDEKPVESEILLTQKFVDPVDLHEYDEKTKRNKLKVISEFLPRRVYCSRIAITNSSEETYDVNIITEIPKGAQPVNSQEHSKSHNLTIGGLSCSVVQFYFYFPAIGSYDIFRPTYTIEGNFAGVANGDKNLEVKNEITKVSKSTIKDIQNTGSEDDILEYLTSRNIHDRNVFNVNQILPLCNNEEFYKKCLEVLHKRNYYDSQVWTFQVKYAQNDYEYYLPELHRWFNKERYAERFFYNIPYFSGNIWDIDKFSLKDYNPQINARAHSVGDSDAGQILNKDLSNTYRQALVYLAFKANLTSEDNTILSSYLLLQDRLQPAMDIFAKAKPENITQELKIQYDYLRAYLSIFTEGPKYELTKEICAKYIAFPVLFWRNLFIEIANQLAEILEEQELDLAELENEVKVKQNKDSADQEEYIEAEQVGEKIVARYRNTQKVTFKFYKTDLEVMFSKNPFLSQNYSNFLYVAPYILKEVAVEKKLELQDYEMIIPEELQNSNIYIQVMAGSYTTTLSHFPTNLTVTIQENYGIVKVYNKSTKKPLPKVYVKCFMKSGRKGAEFYKDGYTDFRGSFDYARLNVDKMDQIEKFAQLIVGDQDDGIAVRECNKPSLVGKFEEGQLTNVELKRAQQEALDSMVWE